jgi:hypothetical protein
MVFNAALRTLHAAHPSVMRRDTQYLSAYYTKSLKVVRWILHDGDDATGG